LLLPPAPADEDEAPETDDDTPETIGDAAKRGRPALSTKALRARFAVTDALHERHAATWELVARSLLAADQAGIAGLVQRTLEGKAKDGDRKRVITALDAYIEEESAPRWNAAVRPIIEQGAEAAVGATAAADLALDPRLLRPSIGRYVEKEAAFLIRSVTDTTRDIVRLELTTALEAGDGPAVIARRIRDVAGFGQERARLIARTETTRTLNGAPMEALQDYGARTGGRYVKSWLATLDDRVRDEHEGMHGETVPVDGAFSNGETHPSSPNCRCGLTYGVAD